MRKMLKKQFFLKRTDSAAELQSQSRFHNMSDEAILQAIRPEVLGGGYRLLDRQDHEGYLPGANVVNLFATGVFVAEAVKASQRLLEEGVFANVIAVTSPPLLIDDRDNCRLDSLIYDEERQSAVPVLTVTDSHPCYLSGVAQGLKGRAGQPAELNLGVTRFDRSGTDEEIKTFHRIDCHSIAYAAKRLLFDAHPD